MAPSLSLTLLRCALMAASVLCAVARGLAGTGSPIWLGNEAIFRAQVEAALEGLRRILDATRLPQYPSDVPHVYEDKFLLAELATRAAAGGVLNLLDVGLGAEWQGRQKDFAALSHDAGFSAVLRFVACERCQHEVSRTREVEAPIKSVTDTSGGTETRKMVTTVDEHSWSIAVDWEVIVDLVRHKQNITVLKGSAHSNITTTTSPGTPMTRPRPEKRCPRPFELDITWALATLSSDGSAGFTINRTSPDSRTPRRNREVENAFKFMRELQSWAVNVRRYGEKSVWRHDMSAMYQRRVFAPVLSLFALDESSVNTSSLVLASEFANVLKEHRTSLEQLVNALPDIVLEAEAGSAFPFAATQFALALFHLHQISEHYMEALAAIEEMLRSQLVTAVGKELGAEDFGEYMSFHQRKLFKSEFWPKVFSYSVRRPHHHPDGTVSIEGAATGAASSEPISTLVLQRHAPHPIRFSLNAATEVSLLGDHFVHAAVLHRFGGEVAQRNLQIVASARQFSSFILLAGKLVASDVFEPKAALIVKDKDEVILPLLLETLPTAKEFRDAIESLSPEQQQFAKAFRTLQLSSSIFCVSIVQVKPQMELLLNLPPNSLTKEIQLTQDLMEMFIKYQVPSDLMSFAGEANLSIEAKVSAVKGHVAGLWSTIEAARKRELEEEEAKAQKKRYQEGREKPASCTARGGCSSQDSDEDEAEPVMFRSMARSAPRAMNLQMRSAPEAMMFTMQDMAAAPEPQTATLRTASAPAPSPPPPQAPLLSRRTRPAEIEAGREGTAETAGNAVAVDYTAMPAALDRRLLEHQQYDEWGGGAALRATKITLADSWEKVEHSGLLSPPSRRTLAGDDQRSERRRAFDLLDALSRSGTLPLRDAHLHVIMATTHTFDGTLIETVVQDNLDPIEKVERSLLTVASTLHGRGAQELLAEPHLERLRSAAPLLFA